MARPETPYGLSDLYESVVKAYNDKSNTIVIPRSLDLQRMSCRKLSDNLIVEGDFFPSPDLQELPKKLTVYGTLYLGGTKVTVLPKDTVALDVDLYGSKIESIPEDHMIRRIQAHRGKPSGPPFPFPGL